MSNVQHSRTVLKTSQNTSPQSTHNPFLHSHSCEQVLSVPKHHDVGTWYITDRLSWRDLAGLAQGLVIYSDKPVMWRDLANLAPEKKNSSAPPGQITLFSAVFPLLIEIFVGWDALAKAKEGQKRKL